ncbi:MAG: hypothetical protein OEY20_13120 [Gemmatimonadota bacterium]|nr:hypothetical protein [Gemmatimonadota bacterium]MDH4352025.1 hypothetical protein [Gemmatimonadota bacterium]MDH5198177.1 hypothetical protein [Gemmatimonadota bacterium]
MRSLISVALGAAFLLVACEVPPTDVADAPSLKSAFQEDMIVPWFYYADYPTPVSCAAGGAGGEFLWSAELAGFGRTHETPSGNYHEVLKVEFRNVEFRSPSGELYPFRRVVQQNIAHTFENGRTIIHWPDNEFYTTPDGRNVNVRFLYHLNIKNDGPPTLERFMISCSPAKW